MRKLAHIPRIVIADGQGLYRRGLRSALDAALPAVEIFETGCLDVMLVLLEDPGKVDVAIFDLHMPGMMSLNVIREVRSTFPDTRFVIMSASESRLDVLSALAAGLHGFIFKSQSDEEIIGAISDILSGRVYVPPLFVKTCPPLAETATNTLKFNLPRSLPSAEMTSLPQHHHDGDIDRLTPRQREVLSLIAEGLPNKEIARKLHISEATTKIHAGALMRVLGVRNRTEAAVLVRTSFIEKKD